MMLPVCVLFGDGEQQQVLGEDGSSYSGLARLPSSCCFGLIPLIYIYWDAVKLFQLWQSLQHLQQHIAKALR